MNGIAENVDTAVEAVYRAEWGRIVATLIRQVGDFELAEDAAQDAFSAALAQWRTSGVPDSPRAWILGVAKNKAIDTIRRRVRYREILKSVEEPEDRPREASDIPDDRLRLICTCCHPALAPEAQVALTLRMVGGLTTDEIARAFLVPEPTMAQRVVRAKRKIREARIPYVVPDADAMPERLEAILAVLYLVFNEGYASTSGTSLMRTDLSGEAIRLTRLVLGLLPVPNSEAEALLALMLLHDARREARLDEAGDLVRLKDQDRSRWKGEQIDEALGLVARAMSGEPGPYALQAAIAAVHCEAPRWEDTDWTQIAGLYRLLAVVQPSPVVSLNRAVAIGMVEGPAAAFDLIERLQEVLCEYHLFHAARADLLRQMERRTEAAEAYRRALELVGNDSERRFLQDRLAEVEAKA